MTKEPYDCPHCSANIDANSLEFVDIEEFDVDETGTVSGERHVSVKCECEGGCEIEMTFTYYHAWCTLCKSDENPKGIKNTVIEANTGYLSDPTGFHKQGYGWEIITECPNCGEIERHTCTLPGSIKAKF